MKVTVGLRKDAALDYGQMPDLAEILGGDRHVSVLKIFGRGRFASIETTPEGLSELRENLGGLCVFTRTPKAHAF